MCAFSFFDFDLLELNYKKIEMKKELLILFFVFVLLWYVEATCKNEYEMTEWFGNLFASPYRIKISGVSMFVIDSERKWVIKVERRGGKVEKTVILQKTTFSLIQNPSALSFDESNNLYILDTNQRLIFKINSGGEMVLKFGGKGKGNGLFDDPVGMAIYANKVFISDATTRDVQAFDLEGKFQYRLPVSSLFDTPFDLSFDKEGNLYVLDAQQKSIKKLNASSGELLKEWGDEGDANGCFQDPVSMAIDSKQRILVVDQTKLNVQIFDTEGKFLGKFGQEGDSDGDFLLPTGIAVDSQDNVYVTDNVAGIVQKFSPEGNFLESFGKEENLFVSPACVTIDSKNNVFVCDEGRKDVKKFSFSGNFISNFSCADGKRLERPLSLSVDSLDRVFVLDNHLSKVFIFDNEGNYVSSFGEFGVGQAQFVDAISVVVDTEDNVYVSDDLRVDIQKWNRSLSYVRKFGTYGPAEGQFYSLQALSSDQLNNIFSSDLIKNCVQKFTSYGKFLCEFNINEEMNDEPNTPTSLSSNLFSEIFVAENNKETVLKFSDTGKFLASVKVPSPISVSHSTNTESPCTFLVLSSKAIFKFESVQQISPPAPFSYPSCNSDLQCNSTQKCLSLNSCESKKCGEFIFCESIINGNPVKCANEQAYVEYLLPPVVPPSPLLFYFPISSLHISHFQRFDYFPAIFFLFEPPSFQPKLPLLVLDHGASLSGTFSVKLRKSIFEKSETVELAALDCARNCRGNFSEFKIFFDEKTLPCELITITTFYDNSNILFLRLEYNDDKCSQSERNWMIAELVLGSIALAVIIVYIWYNSNKLNSVWKPVPLQEGIRQDSFIIEELSKPQLSPSKRMQSELGN